MRGAVFYAPGDVRVIDRDKPTITALRTPSSASPPRVCAAQASGHTGASSRSMAPLRWATSTSVWQSFLGQLNPHCPKTTASRRQSEWPT